MNVTRILNIISIGGALIVGFWLPLHLIDFRTHIEIEVALELIVALISIINLFLHFHEKRHNPRLIRSWFHPSVLLDILAVIPWATIKYQISGEFHPDLLLVNLVVIRHIWKTKNLLDNFNGIGPVAYRLIPLTVIMPLLIHLITCSWIALGSGTSGPHEDKVIEYVKALYWAVTTLATVGYGDISARTPDQMLFASVVMLIGVGTFGFVLSNVASMLSRADAAREHHMANLDKVEVFMTSHEIPNHLRGKVRNYYQYLWNKHKGYSDRSIIRDLPAKMQAELFYFINKQIIEKVPLLSGASEDLLEELMQELQPKIFIPNECIFRVNEPGDGVYFIQHGQVEIIAKDGQVVATLNEGGFFGEMALISDRNRNATARAKSYCDIYVLPKNSFNRVIKNFPEFKEHIEKVVEERNIQNRTPS